MKGADLNAGRESKSSYLPFLRAFVLTVLAFAVLCMAFTYVMDPFYHYHRPWFGMPAVLTEKEYQVPGTLRNFEYDAVLAGSSMIENNDNSWYDDAFGVRTIKAARSYGGIADLCWMLDEAFESRQVKKVFFNLDPAALIGAPETTFEASGCPMYLYDRNPFNDLKYLLNKDVLLEKIPYELAQAASGYNENLSYSWAEGKDFSRQGALEHYSRQAEVLPMNPPDTYRGNVEGNIRLLQQEIGNHPDTEFLFFLPPYSILWWDNALRIGEEEAYLYAQEEVIEALLPYENVRIYDYQNETDVTTNLDYYMDTVHFSPEINFRICCWMADGYGRLDADSFRSVLAETKRLAGEYEAGQIRQLEKESAFRYE